MGDNNRDIGFSKEEIVQKFKKSFAVPAPSAAPGDPFSWFGEAVSKLVGTLIELGLPMPPWLWIRDPRKINVFRQGFYQLNPGAQHNLTFQARPKGYLILDPIEIMPEDPLAMTNLDIRFFERGNVENKASVFSTSPETEPGLYKFSSKVLYDQATLRIQITNTDPFGLATYSMFISGREQ